MVFIGRPTKWGNPFYVGKHGNRHEVIQMYREWIVLQPELMAALGELKGKNLVCFCAPKACHGDVLLELANPEIRIVNEIARDLIGVEPLECSDTFKELLRRYHE